MISIRQFDREADYQTAFAWWEKHGWSPPPLVFLPALGVVAEYDGRPVAAGWCYLDNSCPVAKLEWLVSEPDAAPRKVLSGLTHVVSFLSSRVREPDLGYAVMLTCCRQPALVRLLEKLEFVKTDEAVTNMLLILDPVARDSFRMKQNPGDAVPQTFLSQSNDSP
jgi:hypothetical protein